VDCLLMDLGLLGVLGLLEALGLVGALGFAPDDGALDCLCWAGVVLILAVLDEVEAGVAKGVDAVGLVLVTPDIEVGDEEDEADDGEDVATERGAPGAAAPPPNLAAKALWFEVISSFTLAEEVASFPGFFEGSHAGDFLVLT